MTDPFSYHLLSNGEGFRKLYDNHTGNRYHYVWVAPIYEKKNFLNYVTCAVLGFSNIDYFPAGAEYKSYF